MAATGAQSTQSGAKAPKKKAASKTVDRTASPAPSASHATEKGAANGQQESGSQENAYIREVQKQEHPPRRVPHSQWLGQVGLTTVTI